MRKTTFTLAIALAAVLLAPMAAGQEAGSEQDKERYYRIETNLVAIPVYVIDPSGKPVTGLGIDDFEVFEGRARCRINAVEFIDHLNPARDVYEITPPESRRQFLLLFDLSFTNLMGLKAARNAGMNFLFKSTTPNDLVAVLTVSQRGGVNLLCPFSTRRSQAIHAISTLGLGDALQYRDPAGFAFDDTLSSIESEITSLADLESDARNSEYSAMALENMGEVLRMSKSMDQSRYAGIVTRYVRVLEALAVGLQMLHGRKNVVLFSEGFDQKALTGKSLNELAQDSEMMSTLSVERTQVADSSTRFGSVHLQRLFASLLREFREGNAVFYVIDVGRLESGGERYESRQRSQNTLFQFADETNGILYKNLNNIDKILEDIAQRTSAGYLVIFEPSKPGKPGEFRKVKIGVKRSGLTLDHQSGYFFEKRYKDFSPQEKVIQLSEYVSKDLISQRIPFRFDTQVFAGNERLVRIPVVIEIEGKSLVNAKEKRKSKSIDLELYGYLLDAENRPLDYFFETLTFGNKQAIERLENGGVKYYDLLVAPPGRYKVKCIVRDSELGRISSRIQVISVPDISAQGLRMSGPVFIDSSEKWINILTAAKKQPVGRREGQPVAYPYIWGGRIWTPALSPVIDPSRKEMLFVRLRGLRLHPTANVPQVAMKFEIVDGAGKGKPLQTVALADRSEDKEQGIYDLLFQVDLASQGLEPGEYLLRFTLTDTLARADVSADVPFTVPQ